MSNKMAMDNPHEQVQSALLSRIINSMVRNQSNVAGPTNRRKLSTNPCKT